MKLMVVLRLSMVLLSPLPPERLLRWRVIKSKNTVVFKPERQSTYSKHQGAFDVELRAIKNGRNNTSSRIAQQ